MTDSVVGESPLDLIIPWHTGQTGLVDTLWNSLLENWNYLKCSEPSINLKIKTHLNILYHHRGPLLGMISSGLFSPENWSLLSVGSGGSKGLDLESGLDFTSYSPHSRG